MHMTSQEILRADLLDLLFDNRNKEYGAYTLRKFYSRRLGIALGVALSVMFLFFMISRIKSSGSLAGQASNEVVVKLIDIPEIKPKAEPPPPPPPPARQSAAPAAAQVKLTSLIKITTTDPPPLPNQDDLASKIISNINTTGPSFPGATATSSGTGGPAIVPDPPPAPKEVLVQREPEFPGGAKAWANFLSRNLRAPEELESGEQKKVIIRFQVAVDGSVTGFEVVQSAGQQYDEEVIRVLRHMPKWLPALVNSQPVTRSFTQPVTFQAE